MACSDVPSTTGPSYLTPEEFAQLPPTGTIDPSTIRFSQDSASANFRPPYGSVDDFISGLSDGSIDPSTVAPILLGMFYTVVMHGFHARRLVVLSLLWRD